MAKLKITIQNLYNLAKLFFKCLYLLKNGYFYQKINA